MSTVSIMLEAHPNDLSGIDPAHLTACIEACIECAQTCTACADACLSEEMVADLVTCIRADLDCADICEATARVLSRRTGVDAALTRSLLEACAAACKTCGDECERHASHHAHCRTCAEVCRRCEQACRELIGSLG